MESSPKLPSWGYSLATLYWQLREFLSQCHVCALNTPTNLKVASLRSISDHLKVSFVASAIKDTLKLALFWARSRAEFNVTTDCFSKFAFYASIITSNLHLGCEAMASLSLTFEPVQIIHANSTTSHSEFVAATFEQFLIKIIFFVSPIFPLYPFIWPFNFPHEMSSFRKMMLQTTFLKSLSHSMNYSSFC